MKCVVIGLGRFGSALARELEKGGAQVIAINIDKDAVDEIRDSVTVAVALDATDEEALRAQGVEGADIGVVATGEDFEATVVVTALLKQLGVKRVLARAANAIRARILRLAGADEIFSPEDEAARYIASEVLSPNLGEYVRVSLSQSVMEVKAPAGAIGKSLADLDLSKRYGAHVLGVKRYKPSADPRREDEEALHDVPAGGYVVKEGDVLVLLGRDSSLNKLAREWS